MNTIFDHDPVESVKPGVDDTLYFRTINTDIHLFGAHIVNLKNMVLWAYQKWEREQELKRKEKNNGSEETGG